MKLRKAILLVLCICCLCANAQDWNKKRCAVVLTYDDALNVHLDNVIPALDSLNLKGTFYLTAASEAFTNRLGEWKIAAQKGHELGNHTLFHPCTGGLPGRSFVTAEYDLATYTLRRMLDELRMTNAVLEAIDGKKQRTFAYPCGDTRVGDTSYVEAIKPLFAAARGVQPQLVPKHVADVYNLGSYMINGQSGEELIALVEQARKNSSMVVFLFHGVGGEHGLNVSLDAHRQLLAYLKKHESEIWTTTFLEAVQQMRVTSRARKTKK